MFVRNVVSSAAHPGAGNRREVNDRVDAGEALDGLAEVESDPREQRRRERLGGRSDVDAEDVVAVLEQIRDDGSSRLAARHR